jgi:hypothetical protein
MNQLDVVAEAHEVDEYTEGGGNNGGPTYATWRSLQVTSTLGGELAGLKIGGLAAEGFEMVAAFRSKGDWCGAECEA